MFKKNIWDINSSQEYMADYGSRSIMSDFNSDFSRKVDSNFTMISSDNERVVFPKLNNSEYIKWRAVVKVFSLAVSGGTITTTHQHVTNFSHTIKIR